MQRARPAARRRLPDLQTVPQSRAALHAREAVLAAKARVLPAFARALFIVVAALSWPAVAQPGKGLGAAEMAEECARNRLSESTVADRTRKPIYRPTEQVCRELAEMWLARLVALGKEGNSAAMWRFVLGLCKDIAERVAGRPVEVAWCSRWGSGRDSTFDPPEEIWSALDTTHAQGGADRSALESAVKEMLERRLAPDWDQVQARDHLRSMGFWCEAKPDLATSICSVNITENFTWQPQAQSMVMVDTRVIVTLRSETGKSPGTRQIEVATTRAAL